MIPSPPAASQPSQWRRELARAVRDPADLVRMLDLDAALIPAARRAARLFPLRVPRGFVRRMTPGDPADPLLRQVLPLGAECENSAGFVSDPVGDLTASRGGGLIRKYRGRALVIMTGACAVHCRYCFRRAFPYGEYGSRDRFAECLELIGKDRSITEVILSGGDPLSLSDERLKDFTTRLSFIPHVRCLRIHTRQPIVLPERVDHGLIAWLSGVTLRKVMVVHCNHSNEIDATVIEAVNRLRDCGVTLLNQSVLLKTVNDTVDALVDLSQTLFDAGVLPYYLHQLDRVTGAAHFEVSDGRALELHAAVAARLPGYLVPRLVRETPGAAAKTGLVK